MNLLSFVSGFSDITPFILNLLQNTGSVAALIITACSMQAIISNIMVNMFYALFFAGKGSKLRPWKEAFRYKTTVICMDEIDS